MATKLETTVNIATLVTCAAVVVTLVQNRTASRPTQPSPKIFTAGEQFPSFEGLELKRAKQTLVMIVRHDCRFCAESMPFYQTLSAARREADGVTGTQLAVLTPDDLDTARRYLSDHDLKVAQVVSVPVERRGDLRVPGTPTLVLVDQSRHIKRVWVGRLDATGQEEVRTAMSGSAPSH